MADLGTLALGAFTNVSNTAITGTDPVLEVIASADDADFVFDNSNSDHTSDCWFPIATTLPSDLGNVDTLSINLRYGLSTTKGTNDWLSLRAQVFKSDGTTPLTNQLTVVSSGTGISNTTPANSGAVAFTGVDTAATKSEWQAAQVHILFEINRDGGGDSVVERVYAAELTGTYTAGSALETFDDGDTISFTEGFLKQVNDLVGDAVAFTEARLLTVGRTINDTLGLTENLATAVTRTKALADTLDLQENLATLRVIIADPVADAVAFTEARLLQANKAIAETVAFTEARLFSVVRGMTETLGLTETLSKVITMRRAETVSLTEELTDQDQDEGPNYGYGKPTNCNLCTGVTICT